MNSRREPCFFAGHRFQAFYSFHLCLIWLSLCSVGADVKQPVVQETGVCRFLLHRYPLPVKDQVTINRILDDLLKEHENAFGFSNRAELRIQIRIFGREEDYRQFARTNMARPEGSPSYITNWGGYYSVRDREVVTWRQRDPSRLANNLLHECSHAIMYHQFRAVPAWLIEGCAVYFESPRYMRDQNDERRIKAKWKQIKQLLEEGKLPNLRAYLDLKPDEFYAQPASQTYTPGWSLFQLLMSTPEKRKSMNEMLQHFQTSSGRKDGCAALLDKSYPGGLARLEQDWKTWIARGSERVLGKEAPPPSPGKGKTQ